MLASHGHVASGSPIPFEEEKKDLVLRELDQILSSPFFRNAGRSKQFLQYVVLHRLENAEPLKERTIGVELFDRPNDYATGDDPVVRVQAGEVRRRLERYYRAATTEALVRIEIPVGSYSPVFIEAQGPAPLPALGFSSVPAAPQNTSQKTELQEHNEKHSRRWVPLVILVALLAGGLVLLRSYKSHGGPTAALDDFWRPIFATPQPMLVCLAKATVYRPTPELFDRYYKLHPRSFHTRIEEFDTVLPLAPTERISWAEMAEDPAFGVARGDTYTAVTLAAFLGRIGKPDQVRIGSDYSFSDLKNSPSVIVGAFNNRWTLQITSNLHFAFIEENRHNMIRERGGSGRSWEERYRNNDRSDPIEDSAIVARLLDSGTGQFTIVLAGIGELGTQAASELVTRPELFEQVAQTLPSGWQKRNLELVLETTVTDSVPGPPRVVATYSW